ncbi:MAG: hypothetical protein EBR27_09255 [Betaproteobacteria bacterium]|nr:hypothetical protein [Betaproteobacteria bacterium]
MGGPSVGVYGGMPDTIGAELPDSSLGGGVPVIAGTFEVPRSDGISVSGILRTIEKTAQTGVDIFSKVYQIQDAAEASKVARQINQSRLQLQQAQASGAIEVDLAKTQANLAIEKIRAGAAVANAQAQASSGSAGFSRQGIDLAKFVPFAIIGLVIWKVTKGGK